MHIDVALQLVAATLTTNSARQEWTSRGRTFEGEAAAAHVLPVAPPLRPSAGVTRLVGGGGGRGCGAGPGGQVAPPHWAPCSQLVPERF